jgi:hypothetical protein
MRLPPPGASAGANAVTGSARRAPRPGARVRTRRSGPAGDGLDQIDQSVGVAVVPRAARSAADTGGEQQRVRGPDDAVVRAQLLRLAPGVVERTTQVDGPESPVVDVDPAAAGVGGQQVRTRPTGRAGVDAVAAITRNERQAERRSWGASTSGRRPNRLSTKVIARCSVDGPRCGCRVVSRLLSTIRLPTGAVNPCRAAASCHFAYNKYLTIRGAVSPGTQTGRASGGPTVHSVTSVTAQRRPGAGRRRGRPAHRPMAYSGGTAPTPLLLLIRPSLRGLFMDTTYASPAWTATRSTLPPDVAPVDRT